MRDIDKIIVHCSATPEGRHTTVEEIKQWHLQRGWKDIGYHYVIYLDGTIHRGRPESVVGAHCSGYNKNSIGVCYIGGVAKDGKTPKDTRTEGQKRALREILNRLKRDYPKATLHGHNEFANKACPSFNVKEEYKNL
jgi:N-acetylmuramoyl-L-alanine amidase